VRLLAMLSLVALVTACSREHDLATDPAARLDGVNDSLALTATVSPTEITPGDTAWVTVRLANRLGREVTLHFAYGCQILYYAEDAQGRDAMDHGGFLCTAAVSRMTLAAGERKERRFAWTAMEFTYPPIGYRPRPAGTYRIYGILGFPPRGFMQSAPVEVTVH
jgi:hypothetical protein